MQLTVKHHLIDHEGIKRDAHHLISQLRKCSTLHDHMQ